MNWLKPPPLRDKPERPIVVLPKPQSRLAAGIVLLLPMLLFGAFGIVISWLSLWFGNRQEGLLFRLLTNPFLIYGLPMLFLIAGFIFGMKSLILFHKHEDRLLKQL